MTYEATQQSPQPSLPRSTTPPNRPGTYWFRGETMLWAVMVEVYEKNEQPTVWRLNQEQPVASLKGAWRGPIGFLRDQPASRQIEHVFHPPSDT